MTTPQQIDDIAELLQLLRGLRGDVVEAGAFLPHDEDGYPVMCFSGVLADVSAKGDRWEVCWKEDATLPVQPVPVVSTITIWTDRFVGAELGFTGSADDPVTDVDETRGHNSFIKIRCKGIVFDLVAYL